MEKKSVLEQVLRDEQIFIIYNIGMSAERIPNEQTIFQKMNGRCKARNSL